MIDLLLNIDKKMIISLSNRDAAVTELAQNLEGLSVQYLNILNDFKCLPRRVTRHRSRAFVFSQKKKKK